MDRSLQDGESFNSFDHFVSNGHLPVRLLVRIQIMTMEAIVADINEILSKHGICEVIQLQDITVTDKTVSDMAKPCPKLSNAITEFLWQSVRSATVYHYTSREAAESILSTGIFRLTNIEKRLNDGEIVTFCQTHGLNGYLEKDADGLPKYRTLLMPQLFYASFTEANLPQNDEEYFWRNFAASDGVRLTINITAQNPDFRKMVYEPKPGTPIPLLTELISTLRRQHSREFVLQGISRLCSFYLCGQSYSREKEYRALFKTWPDVGPQPVGTGPTSYVEIPLNQMADLGYEFRITEVHASSRPNMPTNYTFSQRAC